ncbi:putative glucose-methanol-choline oxidoreductase protein [Botrytis fragariae]|uniref:Putative glucose-methanol-choline oxidoreductase protein n=1 Tax=Botrytis fragariae TaxID=1964551 RepID=A0A8H6AHW2_9HELO|nr:putative glucose-methanol-choline oxidoreductase protein [Botrytis fragariae]KAF5867956.1 putative glucose-methanol-choline oxidoreductase protein [Botrytis fragariae]
MIWNEEVVVSKAKLTELLTKYCHDHLTRALFLLSIYDQGACTASEATSFLSRHFVFLISPPTLLSFFLSLADFYPHLLIKCLLQKRNHPDSFHIHTLEEEAKKYVLDTAVTAYHNCGTAAMLPKEKGGVINDKLMVHGTSNLRMVDASIFPLIPRGNIQSSVYAVVEKAADIIKGV